ncbi:MAG TPA: hypothetical protein VK669_03230 [Candidatus Limnocylindrales bacterium]|nr:hypothetical protein [Candidatus Limnocylindrales bacterium]
MLALGEESRLRLDDRDAPRAQRREMRARRLVLEHRGVHRRSDDDRRARRQRDVRQQIVGEPERELRERVRRTRDDREHLGLARERDVRDLVNAIPERGVDRTPRERGERRFADEALRVRGHDDVENRAVLHQPAREGGRLVRRDPAGHAEQHAPPVHGLAPMSS